MNGLMNEKLYVIRCMLVLGSRLSPFEVGCTKSLRKTEFKLSCQFSGKTGQQIWKQNFEALRGRIWKNVKNESCRELKILGGSADRI